MSDTFKCTCPFVMPAVLNGPSWARAGAAPSITIAAATAASLTIVLMCNSSGRIRYPSEVKSEKEKRRGIVMVRIHVCVGVAVGMLMGIHAVAQQPAGTAAKPVRIVLLVDS